MGKAVIVGPSTGDFQQTVDSLESGGGILVSSRETIRQDLRSLLEDDARRNGLEQRALEVVHRNQGASERTMALMSQALVDRGSP